MSANVVRLRWPAVFALFLIAVVPAAAAPRYRAEVPEPRQLIRDGAGGRFLMGGTWLFRRDPADRGLRRKFYRPAGSGGWRQVTVPNAWNAGDETPQSMAGGVVWYRKDFRLPDRRSRLDWIVRFESTNYRAQVWLNGRPVGRHTGARLPWEVILKGVKSRGVNRLVVRVDNRRGRNDLPPARTSIEGLPGGGWWNYGGILGEVYLRRVDGLDFGRVRVRPLLQCATCAAEVDYRAVVKNHGAKVRRVLVRSTYGDARASLGTARIRPGRSATFSGRLRIADPHLWSPRDPYLYKVELVAAGRGTATYSLHSGIRSIRVAGGRILLNDRPINVRGGFFHEDDPVLGGALDNAARERLVAQAKDLGATLLRTHYPLHPHLHELADRNGFLIWSEIPVYQIGPALLAKPAFRRLASRELTANILANQNHPSVLLWSVGNELRRRSTSVEAGYYRDATQLAKRLDPTRPVGVAIAGYPDSTCQYAFTPFDVIGINSYFGWYPGGAGQIADRDLLSEYLDMVRACWPDKGLMVTEFGAEANRHGPAEERGTYAYQQEFYSHHLSLYEMKPWLSGAVAMFKEFRVRPRWSGGNPRADSALHQKGVIDFAGNPKPAYYDVQRWFRGANQYGSGGG